MKRRLLWLFIFGYKGKSDQGDSKQQDREGFRMKACSIKGLLNPSKMYPCLLESKDKVRWCVSLWFKYRFPTFDLTILADYWRARTILTHPPLSPSLEPSNARVYFAWYRIVTKLGGLSSLKTFNIPLLNWRVLSFLFKMVDFAWNYSITPWKLILYSGFKNRICYL